MLWSGSVLTAVRRHKWSCRSVSYVASMPDLNNKTKQKHSALVPSSNVNNKWSGVVFFVRRHLSPVHPTNPLTWSDLATRSSCHLLNNKTVRSGFKCRHVDIKWDIHFVWRNCLLSNTHRVLTSSKYRTECGWLVDICQYVLKKIKVTAHREF